MTESLTALVVATLIAAPIASGAQENVPRAKVPSAMTPTEIAAHNAALAPTDPDFIKCRKTLEIGSLVKKNRVCRTNAKWKEVVANSSQNARDTAEAMTSKAGNSN
jgi:hypothetical protein